MPPLSEILNTPLIITAQCFLQISNSGESTTDPRPSKFIFDDPDSAKYRRSFVWCCLRDCCYCGCSACVCVCVCVVCSLASSRVLPFSVAVLGFTLGRVCGVAIIAAGGTYRSIAQ